MSDIFRDIHKMRPIDTDFVAGRWHVDRVRWGGRMAEMRVALQALGGLGPEPSVKFLIVGRARSGTTLLQRLLDAHPNISCAGELLKQHVFAPAAYLNRVARKTRAEVWGAKFLSYQMVQVHRIHDPVGFLLRLEERGFRFLHLTRSTVPQTLSLAVAQKSRRFHSDRDKGTTLKGVHLDPAEFLARIRWSEALYEFERTLFASVSHRPISYDTELLTPEGQAATVSDICDWLGVPQHDVGTAPLRKLLPTSPPSLVENWDELEALLREEGLQHLL